MSSQPYPAAVGNDQKEPFYDPEFQSSVKKAEKLAKKLRGGLGECEIALKWGSRLHELYKEAMRLSVFKPTNPKLIGFVGNAGVGKSSLINALLDREGLALTDSSGKAVTAFPTEYRYRKADQNANFLIEIDVLSISEANATLQELLDDYRMPYLCGSGELSPGEFEAAEERSYAARQTLESVFGRVGADYNNNDEGNPGFDLETMKDNSEGAYEAVLDKLQKWAHPYLLEEGVAESTVWKEASTVEEVSELMEPFVEEGRWLFLKMTRIYLDSAILQNGIILADLPGYHDANFSRVRSAKKFQTRCEEIFVVSDIKRAIDDPTIQEIVGDNCKRRTDASLFTHPRITSICTHTTIIGDDKNIEKRVPKDELNAAKKRRKELIEKPNMSDFEKMKAQLEADDQWNRFLITARNNRVKTDLKTKYSADIESGELQVFCVDNRLYHTCKDEDQRRISGIPELREFCYTIQAKALFRTANHYIGTEMPDLISSLESWIQKLHNPKSQSLLKMGPVEPLSNELKHVESHWRDTIEKAFGSVIKKYSEEIKEITAAATETCESWNMMHPSSYCAWVNHYGTHTSRTVGKRCWNSELIKEANDVVADKWADLDSTVRNSFDWCLASVKSCMDKITTKAQSASVPHNVVTNLQARRSQLLYRLQEEFYVFRRDVSFVNKEATSGDHSSYIAALMHPVYTESRRDAGKGITSRHRDRIYRRVSQPNLGLELSEMISKNLNQATQKYFNKVAPVVDQVVQAIEADICPTISSDTIILNKYPEFLNDIAKLVTSAEDTIEELQIEAKPATDWAQRLGYI